MACGEKKKARVVADVVMCVVACCRVTAWRIVRLLDGKKALHDSSSSLVECAEKDTLLGVAKLSLCSLDLVASALTLELVEDVLDEQGDELLGVVGSVDGALLRSDDE